MIPPFARARSSLIAHRSSLIVRPSFILSCTLRVARLLATLFVSSALVACRHDVTGADADSTRTSLDSTAASVLTQHNDNARTGWNDREAVLTTHNVNAQRFGLLFTMPVDDQVWAQPLVAGGIAIGGGRRNVVYVATANNTLYALDGDDGRLYWQKNYTAPGMRPPRNTDMAGACDGAYKDFSGNIGIVGTPVIDATTRIIYFVARSTTGSAFVQHLHAVRLEDGTEVAGSPVQITGTVSGSGAGNTGGTITFDAQRQNQRQGLTLVNGIVYMTFASHCDWGPYHGWILGYDASTLQQRVVYNTTPDGYAGGMWESGTGMAADADGNLYVVTGNGSVGTPADPTDVRNRAESALALTPSGSTLRVASYFTPDNYELLNNYDLDYGGMGALLIPDSRYFVTGAKDGSLYLLDRNDMGGYSPASNQARQTIALSSNANLHCQAAYYGGAAGGRELVYVWSENDQLRGFPFDRVNGRLDEAGQVRSVLGPSGQNGAMLSVSSNGTTAGSGIVWASHAYTGDAEHEVSPGILRAFDAADVTKELWNSRQNATRDVGGAYAKFASPTIANGHVYLATFSNRVAVYGLLN